MRQLTGSKRVIAITSAAFLVAAMSGTALAMMDPGLASVRSQVSEQKVEQRNTTFTSPSVTPEPSATPKPNHEVEFRGTVEAITATGWTVGGRTVLVTSQTEVDSGIDIGSEVKVEGTAQPDGSVEARQIKLVAINSNDNGNGNGNENENENENHNGNVNSNENENENENHNGNVNANDNHNENDGEHEDNTGNVNANDNGNDHGGNGNHNENGDDHGGSGGGNHNENGDDHGGGSDD
ncbi:MAG: DUF5666 domain-containing protein [Anaerolineae bacterium]